MGFLSVNGASWGRWKLGKKMGFVVDNLFGNVAWIWLCLMDLTETIFFFLVQTASSVPEEEEDEQSSLE